MFMAGQVLQERYTLRQPLDGACTSDPRQTWLADDLKETRTVVLKFLRFGGWSQWADLKLFEREVQVLRQLSHPRIPQCGESFHLREPEEWVGFVETYIPGESLQALLDQHRRFSEATVQAIAEQVLEILIYLHGCSPPVLHRDIKPSNLILTPDRQVYLIDFGAVQDRPRPAGQSLTVVGTYGYTPMEQFGGQALPASDLYALGATLIHLLAGVPPAELVQADLKILFGDRIQTTPQFSDWLAQMTAPALAHRFSSATQALTALKNPIAPPILEPPQSRILLQPSSDSLVVSIPAPITLKTIAWLELTLLGALTGGTLLVLLPLGIQNLISAARSLDFAGLGAGLLLSMLGGIICLLLLITLKRLFGTTQLTFTSDTVIAQFSLWGLPYRQQRCRLAFPTPHLEVLAFGPTDAAVVVQPSKREAANETPSALLNTRPMTLAEQLSPAEGEWLVQEVQGWLRDHRSNSQSQ
jgi:serine/threonine protein kinase